MKTFASIPVTQPQFSPVTTSKNSLWCIFLEIICAYIKKHIYNCSRKNVVHVLFPRICKLCFPTRKRDFEVVIKVVELDMARVSQIISWVKESFGPRKENNSLKGLLLNHLTLEKTKQNFSSTLMLQAGCIYLGLINPCPETFHPHTCPEDLSPPVQLQMSSQQKNTQNIPPD